MPISGAMISQSQHDELTGLADHDRFEAELRHRLRPSQRRKDRGALVLLDLDRLDQVNDELGAAGGDALVRAVAAALAARVRDTDVWARLGAERFAVLLDGIDSEQAEIVAEDLVTRVRGLRVDTPEGPAWTTASGGVATWEPGGEEEYDAVVAQANAAQQRARRAGGNRAEPTSGLVLVGLD